MGTSNKYQNKYRIESNRCKYWDYSSPGKYFITICIHNRECLFGFIDDEKMHLSKYGEIIKNEFLKIHEYHKRIILDTWVIMPNHIHCIIILGDYNFDNNCIVEKIHEFSLQYPTPEPINIRSNINDIKQYRIQRRKMIIPKILGKFKMQTSKKINILRDTSGQPIWQSNYHDHIIRDRESYIRIKNYIINNPLKWEQDRLNN